MTEKPDKQKSDSTIKKMKQSEKSKDQDADPQDVKREADERQKDLEHKKPAQKKSGA